MSDERQSSDVSQRCQYFVLRKKRNCRMLVKSGKKFCGEHEPVQDPDSSSTGESPDSGRIPCPFDPKHTCFKSRLQSHLDKCRSRPHPLPKYCVKNINNPPPEPDSIQTDKLTINSVSDDCLLNVIQRVNDVYAYKVEHNIHDKILEHEVLVEEMKNPAFGPAVLKHLKQNSSILGHLKEAGLLEQPANFVEFGSGRGQLTYWLTRAVKRKSSCRFLLIDRESHRHKFDNRLKDDESVSVSRIRVDIADLVLGQVEEIVSDEDRNVIGVSKHLCGAATDLALRSLRHELLPRDRLFGLLIALCCHHRCVWTSFVGKDFLVRNGFNEREFSLLCGLTSWATCGSGRPRAKSSDTGEDNENDGVKGRYDKLELPREKREEIGRRVKRILDVARADFVKKELKLNSDMKNQTNLDLVCLVLGHHQLLAQEPQRQQQEQQDPDFYHRSCVHEASDCVIENTPEKEKGRLVLLC